MSAQPPDPQDTEVAHYRAVSASAVVCLVLGSLSVAALLDPLFWTLPLAGIVLGVFSLWRIARHAPALIGRKAALAGLLLSVGFAAAAATDWYAYRALLCREARGFSLLWFEFLRTGQPERAHQLTLAAEFRRPPGEKLAAFYRAGSHWRGELDKYLAQPPVRTLLDLGRRAEVRYEATLGGFQLGQSQRVDQVYAVSYEEAGRQKTFHVSLELERRKLDDGRIFWRILYAHSDKGPEQGPPK